MLRDSGQTVNLVVKRRVVLPPPPAVVAPATSVQQDQQQVQHDVRVTLNRGRKSKEDFGVVLGCRIYVKEISRRSTADRDGQLREGDVLSRINGQPTEGMSLKEARKLLEASKDRLDLVVRRERKKSSSTSNNSKTVNGVYGSQTQHPLGRSQDNPTPPRPPLPGGSADLGDAGDEGT